MAVKEIERKYELLESDLDIIRKNFEFVSEKQIEDIYRDTEDFYLCKKNIRLRQRNWKWELKYPCWKNLTDTSCYDEYYGDEALGKLKQIIGDKKLIKLAEIKTKRQKYKTEWENYKFIIDVDDFWFGKLVEIEIIWEWDLERLKNKIEEFRKHRGLKWDVAKEWKGMLMLKYFRPQLYEYWKKILAKN